MKTRIILFGMILFIITVSSALADSTCYTTVTNIPASCTGGTITQDTLSGTCRTLVCSNGGDSLQVLACDKPTSINTTYFEMYKQNQVGTSVSEICIGTVCISNEGFASKDFPLCLENDIPPVNDTNKTSATLSIAPWYPKENNYVLVCNAQGFTPTSYDWIFGDGQQLLDYVQNNIYHTYIDGSYDASCTAKSNTQQETGTLHIEVGTANQTNQTNQTTCYSNVQSLPVTCSSWGKITSDTFDGCRYITCSDATGNYPGEYYTVKACDKPGSNNPTTLELYSTERQGFAGTEICFGSACISSGIPYKSYSYPLCSENTPLICTPIIEVCDSKDNDCDGQVDEGNVCIPAGDTCYNTLNDLPANCTGSIMSDIKSGCRNIHCSARDGVVQVQACEKTDNEGRYFEMYLTYYEGTQPVVCLGNDCLKRGWGYQRGDYFPVCIGNGTQPIPPNITNQTSPSCYVPVSSQTSRCINSQLVSQIPVDGCTQYVCSGNTGNLTVKACDKPSTSFHPYYFEMYKTVTSGYGSDFCLGSTCFVNSGFAQSENAPACLLTPDARGWTSYLPGWSYGDGIYHATNTQADVPVESYYPEGFGWADYNVSVSMKTLSGYAPADSQLIMRYQSSLNYVACRIMQDYNGTRLEIMDPQHNILNQTAYQFNVGQWYTLQAGIHGNVATCQVANHPETILKATYSLTNTGTVGLRGTHMPVDYQNLTVAFG